VSKRNRGEVDYYTVKLLSIVGF